MRPYIAAVYAALFVILLAVPVRADNCRRVTYSTPYVAPYYVTPHYEVAPYAVPVAIVPSTLYAVAPELVSARLIAIASEDAARKAVAEFAARYGLDNSQPPPAPTVPPLAKPGHVQAPAIPAAKGQNAGPLAVAQGMVGESCVTCHKPGSQRMQLDFAKLNRTQLLEVKHRLTTADPKAVMPPPGDGRKPVADARLDAVDALLNAAPN